MFSVYGGKCLSRRAVRNWVEKFSQERSKVADDGWQGRHVDIATEETVRHVEELIRADRRITIDSVATALGCSHGLACSIMHDRLKFRVVWARRVPRELKHREKWIEYVCPRNISYAMQIKKMYLIGLLRKSEKANVSLMTKRLKRRCGSGWDNGQKLLCCGFRRTGKAMGQEYECWWSICWKKVFSRFEYHIFYVLYSFVTYLLTLLIYCLKSATHLTSSLHASYRFSRA
jgi:hypothetical protein